MKKFILPIALFIFLFLVTSFNVYAQSSDCWKEYSDIKPICDQAITEQNLLEKCDQANNTFHQCLGVDKNPWKLQSSNPGHLTCEEWKKLIIVGTAQNCVAPVTELFERKLWCLSSAAEISQVRSHPVDYILDFDPNSCITTEDDLRQFKAGLPLTSGSSSQGQRQQTKLPAVSSNFFSINLMETWRNIQGFLIIPEGLNSLVQTAEILSGSTEIKIQVPEPAIATDDQGNPWNFLPGYIPHESIEPGKLVRVTETTRLSDKDRQTYLELRPGKSREAVLKIPEKNSSGQPFIENGEIEVVKVKSGVSDSGYDGIRTPNGTVVSVQTHYLVSYDQKKNQTTVVVYEGKVEVKTKDGQVTTVSPDGNKPGLVVVSQKLSPVKLAVAGMVLAVVVGGATFILRKRFLSKSFKKKK